MLTNHASHNGNGNGNGHTPPAPPVSDIQVNTYLLHTIFHRRKRVWAVLGALIFILLLTYNLFTVPQIYSAQVSISMQQSAGAASPLSALAGLGGGSRKYMGILKSRFLAEKVEQQANLTGLLGMTHQEAVDYLSKMLKVDETASDGLMYLSIDLIGPPKMAPNAASQREAIKRACAVICNAYAATFQQYLGTSDTDRETVLMREAKKQYDAINELCKLEEQKYKAFVTGKQGRKAMLAAATISDATTALLSSAESSFSGAGASGAAGGSGGSASSLASRRGSEISAMGSQLASLLLRQSDMKTKLAAARKTRDVVTRMLTDPDSLEVMPDEDPLLTKSREQYNRSKTELADLRITYGEQYPAVLAAKDRLANAERDLYDKRASILRGNTTQRATLEAMEAEYAEIQKEIKAAEKNAQASRDSSVDLEQLRAEVMMHQQARGTLFTKLVEMRSQMVAGQNRMNIIDLAEPPRWAKTGVAQGIMVSLIGAIFFAFAWLVIEYFITNTRQHAVAHA